jgi:hypothetical protein
MSSFPSGRGVAPDLHRAEAGMVEQTLDTAAETFGQFD